MAVDKTLPELFGTGAAQTVTDFTILKASLASTRTPPAYVDLVPAAENTAEGLLVALLNKIYETQDTSSDAQLAIYGPQSQMVEVVSDGVVKPFIQSLFTVRVLTALENAMPDPNKV